MEKDEQMYGDEKAVPAIKNFDDLIAELHKAFAYDKVNVEYVKAVLAAYNSKPRDWKKFALFDQHRYTRNLIDIGNGRFNLMALCWGEGQGSSIHDHSNAHCFVKILDGTLKETMFDWPNESEEETDIRQTAENIYGRNGVTYINDTMGLHRVENPSHSDKAVSLHLYSPPFSECKTFDQRTGHTNKVKVTFWSNNGERTPFKADDNQCAVATDQPLCRNAIAEPENN